MAESAEIKRPGFAATRVARSAESAASQKEASPLHFVRRRAAANTSSAGISVASPRSYLAMRDAISASPGLLDLGVGVAFDRLKQLLGELCPLFDSEGLSLLRKFG